jgi:hypothetical protein
VTWRAHVNYALFVSHIEPLVSFLYAPETYRRRYDSTKPDGATGMAPNARLAIIDLSRGSQGTVSAPDDLSDGYFKPSYDVGARIHSDSWGSDVIGELWITSLSAAALRAACTHYLSLPDASQESAVPSHPPPSPSATRKPPTVYDYSAASLDRWLWEHPEFLSVFAAGNYVSRRTFYPSSTNPFFYRAAPPRPHPQQPN